MSYTGDVTPYLQDNHWPIADDNLPQVPYSPHVTENQLFRKVVYRTTQDGMVVKYIIPQRVPPRRRVLIPRKY